MRTPDERRKAIGERVEFWARRLNVRPRLVRVRRMTRKRGSCSTSGVLTFAADLADHEPGFQDFIIAHELLHLRVPNHGRLFKALMTAYVPDWKRYDVARRQLSGGKHVGERSRVREVSRLSDLHGSAGGCFGGARRFVEGFRDEWC